MTHINLQPITASETTPIPSTSAGGAAPSWLTRLRMSGGSALLGVTLWGVVLCGGLLPGPAQAQVQVQAAPQSLPTITLQAGMYNIRAEVAQSPSQRQIGLMHRPSMPLNDGMLFIFERPELHCFWMKNTLLPLSIAFISDDGRIVNIADMKPQSEASHCPSQPVRYALEMNKGWFAKRGLKAGSQLKGEPFNAR